MDIQGFIEKFAEAIEVEDTKNLSANTEFRSLDEWSSLAAIVVIAMFDEEYDKELKIADFKRAVTMGDLFNLLK